MVATTVSIPKARSARTSTWPRRIRVFAWFMVPVLAWQAATVIFALPPTVLPNPWDTFVNTIGLLGSVKTWIAVGQTLTGWVISLALGIATAIPLALLLGTSGFAFRSSRFVVDALRSLPALGLIPLALLLFGSSRPTELLVAAPTVMWPMLLQLIYGLRSMDPALTETARSLRLGRSTRFLRVQFPTMLPYFMTGLRIAAIMGMLLCVAIEVLAGVPGIGAEIATAQAVGGILNAYSYTVIAIIINVAVSFGFRGLEGKVVPWHGVRRAVAA